MLTRRVVDGHPQRLDDFVEVVYSNGFEGDKLMLLTGDSFKEGGFDPVRCDVLGRALDKLKREASEIYICFK